MSIGRKRRVFVAGILERSDGLLLIERTAGEAGPWRFPRGEAKEGESPEAAMRRVGRAAAGAPAEVVVGQPPLVVSLEEEEVELRYFFCCVALSEVPSGEDESRRWIRRGHLREYEFDAASQMVADWLLEKGSK